MRERPVADVPRPVLAVLVLALLCQLAWYLLRPPADASRAELGPAPGATSLQVASLGEPIALARLLTLYVQAVDAQPGLVSFRSLDYGNVAGWFGRILDLDPRTNYPLLLASNVYGGVGDLEKRRVMYDFVYREFLKDPNRRWRALADAAVNVRHVLKDIPLAREYMHALRTMTNPEVVPIWARQMEIFLMDDMGEVKAARLLLGAMFTSEQITDKREIAFFLRRLKDMEEREKAAK